MNTKNILILTLSFILFISCEKVIDLDLKEAKTQIVVEANVNNGEGNNYVILSKSGSFYESNDFEMVSGANIQISDNTGNSHTLFEISEGIYTDSVLSGSPLIHYNLSIIAENKTIVSQSIMPKLVKIDSLTAELQTGGMGGGPGGGGGDKEGDPYRVYCHFTDPISEDNYYKLRATGSFEGKVHTSSFIMNDDLFNGNSTELGFYDFMLFEGDSLRVELFSIDKANYEYYRLLESNDMGSMSTSIGNPTSNVEGEDVIGVFGANAVDSDLIIIKK